MISGLLLLGLGNDHPLREDGAGHEDAQCRAPADAEHDGQDRGEQLLDS
jgi:hypothetical protein